MTDRLKQLRVFYLGVFVGKNYRIKYWKENNGEFLWGLRQCIIDTKDEPSLPSKSPITKQQFEDMLFACQDLTTINTVK